MIDLNCDLGEGAGHDAELMPLVTSASIACGAHAGDEGTMRAALLLAASHGVAVGAHPGFEDKAHFGRRELAVPAEEAASSARRQVLALQGLGGELGVRVRYVKLHGALYNQAARDPELAAAIADALRLPGGALPLVVLPGSALERACVERGIPVVREFFADRTYQPDGSLTPRDRPDALVQDEREAVARVLRMVREGAVWATDGTSVHVRAETVCLHGDGPRAVAFARRLRAELAAAGIGVRPFSNDRNPLEGDA